MEIAEVSPTIKLFVTKKDIENGEPDTGDGCPIALSAKRRFGVKHGNVHVDYNGMVTIFENLTPKEKWYLEDKGKNFIYGFDRDLPQKPCIIEATKLR